MRRLLVALCAFAASCTDTTPVEHQASATTLTPSTTIEAQTTSSTVFEVADEGPPLCTDLYPDLAVEGDLSADRFVADAQILRSYYGWTSSEQSVRQLLASLEGIDAYRGPFTDDEWDKVHVAPDETPEPLRLWPDEIVDAVEWLRLHGHVSAIYRPSLSTITVTYPADTGSEFAALMDTAREALAARPPSGDQDGVVWREVDYSSNDLQTVASQLSQATNRQWLDGPEIPDLRANRIAVELGIADPGDANRIPEEFLPYVCLRTPLAEASFGPQPAAGEGWRILAVLDDPLGLDRSLYLSDSRTDLEEVWRSLAIPDPVPNVDFDRELVVTWQSLVYALCDNWIRFNGHILDPATNKLNAQATDFVYPYGCLASATTRLYIVAIESGGLPSDVTAGELVVTRVEPTD